MKVKSFNVEFHVPVIDDNGIRFTIIGKIIQPNVDEIKVPKEFTTGAKEHGFDNSQYMLTFIFKAKTYQLVGFKSDRCLVTTGGKRFRMKPAVVKKYLALANEAPVAEKKAKAPANNTNKAVSTVTKLNDKLKKAGLWVKGCQFLSSVEKQSLMDAKSTLGRKKIYQIVTAKLEKVYGKK